MITYPLNNIDYTAEDAELFHCTRTSGIWAENSFSISVTGADNNVTIGKGIAWINNEEFAGKVAALKTAKTLDMDIADSTYPRIDVVAIQFNANNNATDVIVKKGIAATNPIRPAITRTGSIYELYLASIYRPTGSTVITAGNITDLRLDNSVCGLMADSVTRIDTSAINAQILSLIETLNEEIENTKELSGLMFENEWTENGFIPLDKGGTGASDRATGLYNLLFLGSNPAVASDTREEWNKHKNFIAYFDSNAAVINKPPNVAANGMMQQISTGNVLHQFWYEYSKNKMYTRSANTAGWSGSASVDAADAWERLLTDKSLVNVVTKSGTNLNDYNEDGWYFFSSSVVPTNVPAGSNGWLLVSSFDGKGSSFVKQFWFRAGTLNSNDFHMFTRTRAHDESSWSNWATILTDKNGVTMKKVWTNSKVGTFAQQKLTLNLSGYTHIMVQFLYDVNMRFLPAVIVPINTTGVSMYVSPNNDASVPYVVGERAFEAASAYVSFGNNFNTQGNGYTTTNTRNIPYQIYGIKGVL